MKVTITPKRVEGQYLVYNRIAKKLSFEREPLDDAVNLLIGRVQSGEVAGKRASYWIKKIKGQG